ncbi:MAG: thioredoxin domain-containing protein [Phycisphaerales bacterium]
MVSRQIEKTNRLIEESSPYLLQHARNPVDWYPWKTEAFEKAKNEDKPIFLSIGYSSCHWCHVMEKESFQNQNIAQILNHYFICIKVDREERQDVDEVYMNAVQAMTGTGGWPLSVFMTPDCKPFFGGTYFPPRDLPGRPGFEKVLLTIAQAWEDNRQQIVNSAGQISQSLQTIFQLTRPQTISEEILTAANFQLQKNYDDEYGGFGKAPKFPQAGNLLCLLNYWYRTEDSKSLEMVEQTLQSMAKGGICDQLAGGFHRYSTDERWLVPHFEKMIYDQALLSKIYLNTYQATGREFYALIAKDIFEYVLNDMTDSIGGFYTAEDADTMGKEGNYYIWQMDEIEKILGKHDADIFNKYYGVTNKGNFEERKNVLHINRSLEEVAELFNLSGDEVKNIIAESRFKLKKNRDARPKPQKDDKIITGWNGLIISSLALGANVLNDKKYLKAAVKCANFILKELVQDNRLMRYYRNEKTVNLGVLDDYAFFITALMDLYEADFDVRWLIEANKLILQTIDLFENPDGGFYLSGKDDEQLFIRSTPSFDNPIPSGNAAMALALLKFGKITTEQSYIERAKATLDAFSSQLVQGPALMSFMLCAFDFFVGPSQEIVIASESTAQADVKKMLKLIHSNYLPNSIVLLHTENPDKKKLEKIAPYIKEQTTINGKTSAYICNNYVCGSPITNVSKLESELKNLH